MILLSSKCKKENTIKVILYVIYLFAYGEKLLNLFEGLVKYLFLDQALFPSFKCIVLYLYLIFLLSFVINACFE